MERVEDKYVLSEYDLIKLEKRIQSVLKPDIHGTEDGYKISSIYFDDIYNSSYMDSLSGNPFRSKYRIRIYNDSLDIIKLEIKQKKYNRAVKISSNITSDELEVLLAGNPIAESGGLNDARTIFNFAIKTRKMLPKIDVTYDRHAYLYEVGNVRITFDRNLRASKRVDLLGNISKSYDYPEGCGSVLEVKYDECMPKFIAQLLEHEKMSQTSNSKYVICSEMYNGRILKCRQKI